jgi:hypothetical protein
MCTTLHCCLISSQAATPVSAKAQKSGSMCHPSGNHVCRANTPANGTITPITAAVMAWPCPPKNPTKAGATAFDVGFVHVGKQAVHGHQCFVDHPANGSQWVASGYKII